MCTRNTIPDCRYDDGHVGSCEPWPAWAAELREENARLRAALDECRWIADQDVEWCIARISREHAALLARLAKK